MSHPEQAALALYAGGELGLWERRRAGRHLRVCADCRRAVEEFRAARQALRTGGSELPAEAHWAQLAAEMKANIRVGLSAGQCVGPVERAGAKGMWKTAVAVAPVTLLVLAGLWLQRSQPPRPAAPEGIVLEATSQGIQLRQGEGVLAVQHPQAAEVTHSVSAEGTLRARYLDSETGYVTIAHVYAE